MSDHPDPTVMAARTAAQELRDFVEWDTSEIAEAAAVIDDALDYLERDRDDHLASAKALAAESLMWRAAKDKLAADLNLADQTLKQVIGERDYWQINAERQWHRVDKLERALRSVLYRPVGGDDEDQANFAITTRARALLGETL